MDEIDFQIGKIENDRFVIMRQYQAFAEFYIREGSKPE